METTKVRVLQPWRSGMHAGAHQRVTHEDARARVAAGEAEYWPGYEPAEVIEDANEGRGAESADQDRIGDANDKPGKRR